MFFESAAIRYMRYVKCDQLKLQIKLVTYRTGKICHLGALPLGHVAGTARHFSSDSEKEKASY